MKIKKQKHKRCLIKRKFKFEDYKNFLEVNQLQKVIKHLKSNGHTTRKRYRFDVDIATINRKFVTAKHLSWSFF